MSTDKVWCHSNFVLVSSNETEQDCFTIQSTQSEHSKTFNGSLNLVVLDEKLIQSTFTSTREIGVGAQGEYFEPSSAS